MPLSPAFRKDLGNLKKTVLQDRNFSQAKAIIEMLLTDQQQNQTYVQEEIDLLRHALLHLEAIITEPDQTVQFGKLGRILNEDTEKVA